MLLVALIASTAMAGCANKDRDDGPAPNPFVTQGDADAGTLGEYARYYQDGQDDTCEGCIRLDPALPADRDVHRVYETTPGATVPFPAIGDRLMVTGERRAPTGSELGGMPFPTDPDGQYHFELLFEAVSTMAPAFASERPLARFETNHVDGTYRLDGGDFAPYRGELLVDLETRAVIATTSQGTSTAHPDALVGAYADQARARATHMATPPAANLFWLGAHLWGKTWYEDDTFTASWTPPGAERPALWYDYLVTKAETMSEAEPPPPPDGSSHDHPAPAPPGPFSSLIVRVDVHDHFGRERRWELKFEEDSPYPTALRLTRDMHAAVDRSLIPPEIVRQWIDLVERGTRPAGWANAATERPAAVPIRDRAWFQIDARPASPALDALPVYPLTAAIEDLGNLDPSFREWWRAAPHAILVEAALEPVLVYSGLASARELQWTVTFLDAGTTHTWSVSRLVTGPDTVAPVAHRAETGSNTEAASAWRLIDPTRLMDTRLSAGDGLGAALVEINVTALVDRAHYTLTYTPQEGIGGRLMVGVAHLLDDPAGPGGGSGHAGFLVQDLATGAVVDALVYD